MTYSEKNRYIAYMALEHELKKIAKKGASLYLEGRKSDAKEIAAACIFNEETNYMRDYVWSESGRLAQLKFDAVNNI
ncbi:MAG: hypothetical protein MJ086_07100 [Lachnospiraceae bacterium]|nr:hypothetical protein [Lachnospiraceae bacterium]